MRRLVNVIIAPQRRESRAMSVAVEGVEIDDRMSLLVGKTDVTERRTCRDLALGLEQPIRFEGDGVGGILGLWD